MASKKTKTVFANEYSKETVQNKNNSNSNLKEISYSFDMKGKDANKNNKSEKSTYCFMNCKVLLEDALKSKLIYHGPFEKTSETLNEQNKLKENPNFEVHKKMKITENRFETKNGKKTSNKMKTRSKSCVDKPTEMSSKTSKKNKYRNSNKNNMKTVGLEEKKGTIKKSSNLPVHKDGKLTENRFETKNGKKTSNKMKTRSKSCVDKPTEMSSKTSKKNKYRNSNKNNMKTIGPEEEKGTVKKTSNLPVNKDEKLTESEKLEELNADQSSKNYTTTTTVNISDGRPTVIDAYYQECDTSNSNDCSHKRKLSDIKKTIDSFLKRLKPS